ncbi:site-specific integrase [Blastococcus sp. TF02A-35]|uniref:site-specific integrase n=1 Tax=Blastococcus sp. TF02A-35 TaxID=2559612 RepID=UPI001FD78922|nr:site-specific integrase [Blastococcus sp. TF02A_35]
MDDNLIARNPSSIRGAGQERSSERPMFTVAQVQALVEAVEDRWRALILLAAWTGLRIGELSALRREHLDLKAGTVSVTSAVVDVVGQQRSYGPPKSAAGRRSVAIPPHIIGDLQHHLAMYAQPGPHGLVFVGPKGGPIRRNNFTSRVWAPQQRRPDSRPALTCTTCAAGEPPSPPVMEPPPRSSCTVSGTPRPPRRFAISAPSRNETPLSPPL